MSKKSAFCLALVFTAIAGPLAPVARGQFSSPAINNALNSGRITSSAASTSISARNRREREAQLVVRDLLASPNATILQIYEAMSNSYYVSEGFDHRDLPFLQKARDHLFPKAKHVLNEEQLNQLIATTHQMTIDYAINATRAAIKDPASTPDSVKNAMNGYVLNVYDGASISPDAARYLIEARIEVLGKGNEMRSLTDAEAENMVKKMSQKLSADTGIVTGMVVGAAALVGLGLCSAIRGATKKW